MSCDGSSKAIRALLNYSKNFQSGAPNHPHSCFHGCPHGRRQCPYWDVASTTPPVSHSKHDQPTTCPLGHIQVEDSIFHSPSCPVPQPWVQPLHPIHCASRTRRNASELSSQLPNLEQSLDEAWPEEMVHIHEDAQVALHSKIEEAHGIIDRHDAQMTVAKSDYN